MEIVLKIINFIFAGIVVRMGVDQQAWKDMYIMIAYTLLFIVFVLNGTYFCILGSR